MPIFTLGGGALALAAVSAAASIGGTIAQQASQAAIRKKQKQAQFAEMARQSQLDKKKQAEIDAALPEFGKEKHEESREEIASELEASFQPTVDTQTEYAAGDRTLPTFVKDAQQSGLADTIRKGQQYAKNRAELSSYGQKDLFHKFDLNRLGERVGDLNTTSRRSSDALQLELSSAYDAGDTGRTASTVLQGVSGLADAVNSYQLFNRGLGVPKGGGFGLPNMNVRGGNLSATTIPTGFGV